VGRARCRPSRFSPLAPLVAGLLALTPPLWLSSLLALTSLAGCSESAEERFSVQAAGARFFVRERRGWFSTMFPCKPAFSSVPFGSDQIRMVLASCRADDEDFSITFGRFKLPPGTVSPSMEQMYAMAGRGMDGWASRAEASRLKMEQVTVAGRPAIYLSFKGLPGGADAHVWVLWAQEQQAIYQIMSLGKRGPAEGQRMVRAMLVPSP
jgi:hypothetical protein